MAFELAGFTTQTRDGVVVQVNRTTRLDLELSVGGLQETVTVSGESPVVDVSSTVTQTNISKDLYEAIPTGRNPWVMAGLVPGVVTGRLDVGGTEGMQQATTSRRSGRPTARSRSRIDGLKTNWAGGSGGATMQCDGFEMYEEYNMQTASGTAESDVSGVYMNMVTKSGGNRVGSDNNFYFMNDSMQGENVDADLRRRLGIGEGVQTGRGRQPDGYGFSMAVMVRAGLGLDPWDVFHQGLARHTGITIGIASAVVGVAVLLAWIPLRNRPGIGTIANVIVIAITVDAGLCGAADADLAAGALAHDAGRGAAQRVQHRALHRCRSRARGHATG